MKALIYLRISSDRSGEELGVTRQLEDCEKLASLRGWEVIETYRENDTSAAGKESRPKFEAMLRALEAGIADVVVAWNLDRLTRNRRDTVRIIELGQKRQLTIALARGTDLDMSTPMGRMMADQLAGWARYEIEQKSERHKRANLQRAEAGQPHKGRRAFGYSQDGLTLDEREAPVLKDIGQRFLDGWSYTQIANYLNANGHTTAMGNRFYSVAIRQMLLRPRYAGLRQYDGALYPAVWPAVWDMDTWERIQRKAVARSYRSRDEPKPRHFLLTGLMFCGSCGATMNGTTTYDRKTGEPRKTYRCNRNRLTPTGEKGCGKVSRGAVPMDWWLKEMICYRLDSPELAALLNVAPDTSPVLSTVTSLETRLTELVDDYTDGTLTKIEYKRAKERVNNQLKVARRELNRLSEEKSLLAYLNAGDQVKARWEQETLIWRRSLVDLLVERITVNATRKLPRIEIEGQRFYFDSKAVDVSWRS